MEGWLDDQYYYGTGNAHLLSPQRQLEAGGDRVDYYAAENGKAILTGNAWVYQDNNTIRGNRLTVYLAEKSKTNEPANKNPFEDKKPKKPIEDPTVAKPFS